MLDTLLFFGYFAIYLVLLILGIRLAKQHGWNTLSNVLLLILFGLVYDNAILALGKFIGEGNLLERLSYPRFYMHAFFTPLLVLFSLSALKRAAIQWAFTQRVQAVFYLITLSLILYELLAEINGLSLSANWNYGVLSYSNADASSGAPLMVLMVSIVLLISSLFIWRKQKWGWFFAATVIMFVGNAFPISLPSAAIANAFELILIVGLFLTKRFQDKRLLAQSMP